MTKNKSGEFTTFQLNSIYQNNCIDGMKSLPDKSIDIVIADPPYNASKGGNWEWKNSISLPGLGGDWKKVSEDWDSTSLSEYFYFTLQWLTEVKRVTKPSGSIWIHGTYHNIGIVNFVLQLLNIEIINEVIWYKRNSFPNLSGRRLTASHETILWAHTGTDKKRKYFFDYERSKKIFDPSDLLKEQGKQLRTVWDIPNNKKNEELAHGKHPTQKPLRLINRMLEISAKPGSLLLVPFVGSGTDCVAAINLGINFIGFEIDKKYIELAKSRIKETQNSINSKLI